MLGSTSSGKTTTMRAFVSRVAIADRIPFLMLDWNGENEEWAKSAGAAVWRVPEHFKVNLFKLNGMGRESRASIAVEGLAAAAHLTALQSTKVKSALLRFYMEGREPSLLELWKAVCYRNASKANVLDQRLRAIQRVIGCEPEEFWSGVFERNSVISMMGLNGSEKALVAYAILQRLAELFDKDPWKGRKPRLMVVIDEAWQLLRREKEFDTLKESVAERIVRLGRKYGVGIIVSTQQLDDVPKVFVNSSSLLMVHQHREASWFGRDLLQLNRYESAYMRSAAQGEMLLFDRGRAQEGIWYSEYVKVEPLSSRELQSLAGTSTAYSPRRISEPEMPLELADAGQEEPAEEGKPGILNGLEIPSVALYRFLVALSRTGKPRDANRMLKERGWITSDTTIYGNSSKPSILARAQGGGYVSGDARITEKGLKLIDPDRLIAKQGIYAGSEEHKELMRKAIRLIQDKGNLAFTLSDKDAFDVGEIRAKTKNSWDLEHITAYECQTNAIKEEIEKCVRKAERMGSSLVFVAHGGEISEKIAALTGNKYELVSINDNGRGEQTSA